MPSFDFWHTRYESEWREKRGKFKHANTHRFIDKSFWLSICLIKTQLDTHTQAQSKIRFAKLTVNNVHGGTNRWNEHTSKHFTKDQEVFDSTNFSTSHLNGNSTTVRSWKQNSLKLRSQKGCFFFSFTSSSPLTIDTYTHMYAVSRCKEIIVYFSWSHQPLWSNQINRIYIYDDFNLRFLFDSTLESHSNRKMP